MRLTQHIIIALSLIIALAGMLAIRIGHPAYGLVTIVLSTIVIIAAIKSK